MHGRPKRTQSRAIAITGVLTLTASFLSVVLATPAAAASCPDVVVIGARGSAEPPSSVVGAGQDQFYGIGESLYENIYEPFYLDARSNGILVEVSPVNYPAVPVEQAFTGGMTASVQQGANNAGDQVVNVLARGCKTTPQIVMMGYSQGAMVIKTALNQLNTQAQRDAIKAVYLIGDPQFDASKSYSHGTAGGGNGLFTAAVAAQYLAPIMAARGTPRSIALSVALNNLAGLNRVAKPLPAQFSSRTYDFCIAKDPMCQPRAAGIGTLLNFFAQSITHISTGHEAYKNGPIRANLAWLEAQLKIQPFTPKPITINPASPTPMGTSPVVSSSCPTGTQYVDLRRQSDGLQINGGRVNSDGSFAYAASPYPSGPPASRVADPVSGSEVFAPEQQVWYFKCFNSSDNLIYQSGSFPYTFTAGLAIKTSITSDDNGYKLEVAPYAPCSSILGNSVSVMTDYSSRTSGPRSVQNVETPLAAGGNWSPVALTYPLTANASVNVVVRCNGSNGSSLYYTPISLTLT